MVAAAIMRAMTVVRYLHELAVIFFVGGQLLLAIAVTPAVRRHGTDAAMREAARRFGMGSAVALLVLIATGVAMASHFDDWARGVLHVKLALVALVFVLLGLHVVRPRTRGLSLAMIAVSLGIVWCGVDLAHP
jgi:uncharacterized membrane protein